MYMMLVPLSKCSAKKYREVPLNLTVIQKKNEFEDILYLFVNILTKTSTIWYKLKKLSLSKISKLKNKE